ncbi:MAG: Uma2 family endonuclease [Oscillospiraceae bacterium]|jgi:Uma2 family endonuclease|nr:Uma2 family endonuclease [Oscillospiraceae bacterium]
MAIPVFEDERPYEVINGQIYYMAIPTTAHRIVQRHLSTLFDNFLRGKKCQMFYELSVFLNNNSAENKNINKKGKEPDYLIPDILVVCDPEKIRRNGIYGAPDLVIEVLSPSSAIHDIFRKKTLYEQLGVREYWIVSPYETSITVFLFQNDDKYDSGTTYYDADKPRNTPLNTATYTPYITTSLYGDDLKIYIKDIFADVDLFEEI